tara:strand:+ start:1020 stop:1487 length:468 start_codon:yes stop_codon:yes gene_type:complete
MAIKLIRHAGTISASDTADDAAHSLDCGLMGKGQALRVNEFGGQDLFIKVTDTDTATAATSSNGLYLRANTSVVIVPDGARFKNIGGETGGFVVQDTAANAGDPIVLEGTDENSLDEHDRLLLDGAEVTVTLSVINETGGSDGAVHVEVITEIQG